MANSLQFNINGENVTFTLTAATADQDPAFTAEFTTASGGGGTGLFLKIYETGSDVEITDYSTMEQGKLYDIKAVDSEGNPVEISTWGSDGAEFVNYIFVPDRRPIAAFGFANNSTSDLIPPTTTNGVGMHWGVNRADYRRTPLTGGDMSDPATNGRLQYANDNAGVVSARGFERIHYWNIAGFTNYQSNQRYYNSNPYTGLGLTEAKYIQTANTISNAVTSPSPFTPNGVDGTPGDSEAAWAYAVQATKDLVTAAGNNPEVGVYCGYRAFYEAADMQTVDRTFLGHSPDWTGTTGSPGFLASTGFDYVDEANPGYSASDEAYNNWFAPELAGLYTMGFDTIGLDVGAKIFLNTKGMITGGSGINNANPPFTTGDDRLIDLFNSYGIKPYAEAIPMETYGLTGDPLTGANAEAYSDIAYMGFWKNSVGYSGLDENGGSLAVSSNTCIYNPTGGDGTATVGPNANTWNPATTEVHAVIRWGSSDLWPILGLESDGSGGTNSLGYGWLTMKQVLYDLHTAGMVVGISASVNNSMTDGLGYEITAAEFHQYVLDLSTGYINTRPKGPVQTITWNLSNSSPEVADSITSSGLDIIDVTRTSGLMVSNTNAAAFAPRFFNGTEANNYGAVGKSFTNVDDCRDWWRNYDGRVRKNGGPWIRMTDKTDGSDGDTIATPAWQPSYMNVGSNYALYWLDGDMWTAQQAGDVLDFEIYDAGDL